MATYTTYAQIGIKEDVSNIITNIDPTMTPFQTMVQKGRIKNPLYEWQEDSLAAVRFNAAVEGADAASQTLIPTVLRQNRSQILEKTIVISGTSEAVDTYGRASETAFQSMKASKEIKRDHEAHLVGRAQNAAAGNASTPRQFGNVLGQDNGSNDLVTNRVAGGATPNPTAGAALVEDNVLDLHETLYREGADPRILMVTPKDARIIASFSAAAGRERDFGSRKEIVNAVDLYVSPYGELRVVINRFLQRFLADDTNTSPNGESVPPTTTPDAGTDPDQLGVAFMFDPAMWEVSTLRPYTRTELARNGDSRRYQLLGEYGLKHKNYRASGLITGLN